MTALEDCDDVVEVLRENPTLALRSPATNGDLFVGVQGDHFVLAQVDELHGLDVSQCDVHRVRMLASDDDAELVDRVDAVEHLRERKRAGENTVTRQGGQVRATIRCGSCGRDDFETVDGLKNHDCPDEDDEDDEGHSAPALVTDGGRDQEEPTRCWCGAFAEHHADGIDCDACGDYIHADLDLRPSGYEFIDGRWQLVEEDDDLRTDGGRERVVEDVGDRWPEADGAYRIRDAETGGDEA